jgi:nitrate reductase molybdenum cofactor assembly chaperone
MNETNAVVLTMAARLTGYPSSTFREELEELVEIANAALDEEPVRMAILNAAEGLAVLPLREAQERYVAAFDLKDRTGLYLTAHELGDSRKRGVALLELREMAQSHGFEPLHDELPDYLPMLYELAAVVPSSDSSQQLVDRLAFATHRIRINLPDDNPYKPIFELLMETVFDTPTDEIMQERERSREKPDLDAMPYPLMYK